MRDKQTIKLTLKQYKELYDSLYYSLCLFSNNYLEDLELSKDIVQDVFIKIWKQKIEFASETSIKSYLYKSVRNKCLDVLKSKEYKSKFKLTEYEYSLLESDDYFEKEVLIEEISRVINEAVGTLPERCKEIINLSLKGFENSQISEELSLSINTVKAQKRIAYQKLRPLLKENLLGLFIYLMV